ncbi:MAG: sodium/glutamate symporter [Acidobacteriota bacterium]
MKLNLIQGLGIACLALALGLAIRRLAPVLERLAIPAAVLGGLVFSLAGLLLRQQGILIEYDNGLRDLLFVAFFTTVGLNARIILLKVGGPAIVLLLVLASVAGVLQNLIGIAIATLMGVHPLLGIVAGSLTLMGGPATGLAFGDTFEKLGIAGASSLALAAATFGILCGGLLGGPLGTALIERHRLFAQPSQPGVSKPPEGPLAASAIDAPQEGGGNPLNEVIVLAMAMGLGSWLSAWIQSSGILLPGYIGAMIVAGIFRNLNDRMQWVALSDRRVGDIGNISLALFIAMALVGLRLWELYNLALPLVTILIVQVLFMMALSYLVVFRLMGRDYEAAVISGGFVGFMLGITANAVACMEAIVIKFGPAPRAYLVVPIVGAFLMDFTNSLIITVMANLFA